MSPRFFLFLIFVFVTFLGNAFCIVEPISATAVLGAAAISGGASIISGIMGLYGGLKGAELSAAAQREANELSYSMWREQSDEEKKRFNVAKALEKLRLKLYMEDREFSKDEYLENKQHQRVNEFTNNIIGLADRGASKGMALAQQWAGVAQLPIQ